MHQLLFVSSKILTVIASSTYPCAKKKKKKHLYSSGSTLSKLLEAITFSRNPDVVNGESSPQS